MSQTVIRAHSIFSLSFNPKILLWFGAGLALLLLLVYFGIGAIAASQLTLPKRVFNPAINPSIFYLKYEDFTFPARGDGVSIAAWYIPSAENQRAIILVHGRDNSRSNGFGDRFVTFANALHQAGFSVMLIDLRGHGQSAASRYTFGIKERRDILGAVDWLVERGVQPGKIGVLGYSLGAASVVGAASEEQAIGAIWIDSSYADVESVIAGSWKAESGLPQVFYYSTKWMVSLLYGYDITASRPVDEIAKIAPRPIFIAHCQSDPMIPVSHMERLVAVAKNTRTWVNTSCDQHGAKMNLVPEKYNNHALGYNIQPAVYEQKVIQFFNDSLK